MDQPALALNMEQLAPAMMAEFLKIEDELGLARELALAIGKAETVDDALAVVLRQICETTLWNIGQAWLPTADGSHLQCSPAWYSTSVSLQPFREASTSLSPARGDGLLGRVWASKKPLWIVDATAETLVGLPFSRQSVAVQAGLRACMMVPVLDRDEVIAMLEFLVFEPRDEDRQLLDLVATVGLQIGALIGLKQVQQELHFRKTLLESQSEASIDGIVVVGPGQKILTYNRRFLEMWGFTRELVEAPDLAAYKAMVAQMRDPDSFHARIMQLYQNSEETTRDELQLRDGRTFDRYSAPVRSADGVSYGRVFFLRDVTDAKRAEAALRESEERFRSLVSHTPGAVYRCAADGEWSMEFLSDRIEEITGHPASAFLGERPLSYAGLIHEADRAAVKELLQNALDRQTAYSLNYRITHTDGAICWIHEQGGGVFDEAGAALRREGVIFDVTWRRQAENALRESEERFAGAFAHAAIGMALIARDGRWLQANQALCELTGYSEAELLTTTLAAITHPADVPAGAQTLHRLVAGEIRAGQLKKRLLHKQGHQVPVLLSISLVPNASGGVRYFLAQVQDLTRLDPAVEPAPGG